MECQELRPILNTYVQYDRISSSVDSLNKLTGKLHTLNRQKFPRVNIDETFGLKSPAQSVKMYEQFLQFIFGKNGGIIERYHLTSRCLITEKVKTILRVLSHVFSFPKKHVLKVIQWEVATKGSTLKKHFQNCLTFPGQSGHKFRGQA